MELYGKLERILKVFVILTILLILIIGLSYYARIKKTKESLVIYNNLLTREFKEVFDEFYFNELNKSKIKRGEPFRIIFDLAREQSMLKKKPIIILETGSLRKPFLNLHSDGSSTLIFNHFVKAYGGEVYSVDKDPACKSIIENIFKLQNTKAFTGDSLEYLKEFAYAKDIMILYLDSFDVDFKNSDPSASHHLKEIEIIFDKLPSGTIIAVDDNINSGDTSTGKGYKVERFLDGKAYKIYDGYIKVFQVK